MMHKKIAHIAITLSVLGFIGINQAFACPEWDLNCHDAVCGLADGGFYNEAPPAGSLCEQGTAGPVQSIVSGTPSTITWQWTCNNSNTVTCSAEGPQVGATSCMETVGNSCNSDSDCGTNGACVPAANSYSTPYYPNNVTTTQWNSSHSLWNKLCSIQADASLGFPANSIPVGAIGLPVSCISPAGEPGGGTFNAFCRVFESTTNPAARNAATLCGWKSTPKTCQCNELIEAGVCGSANGQLFSTPPTLATPGLCDTGTPSGLTGTAGVWGWSCDGSPVTMSITQNAVAIQAQCNSRKQAACGSANGQQVASQPSNNQLCNVGWSQNLVNNNPATNVWSWSCVQGSSNVSCNTQERINNGGPICGSSHQGEFTTEPTQNLCTSGNPVEMTRFADGGVYNAGGWKWLCKDQNTGVTAACNASKRPAQCGPAADTYISGQPVTSTLCSIGTVIGPVELNIDDGNPSLGKIWKWGCSIPGNNQIGDNDSVDYKECKAFQEQNPPLNVACGSAHGQNVSTAPSSQAELCAVGLASDVFGDNPWSWTCTKVTSNGSQTINCSTDCEETTVTDAPVVCDMNDPQLAGVCYTPSAQATFIVTNNKVGINTMNPEYELDVNGTMRAAEVLVLSDERVKENITKIDDALEKIRQINGYTFTWKKDGRPDMGVLAQEIEKVFADAVRTDTSGTKTVQYNALIAPILEAIKELNIIIDSHIEKANKQANDITKLEQKIK